VANLKPAKIRGVESQGMILAARSGDEFVLLGPQGPIPPGAKIS
jgi:methionyl-tRNA synthetase